MGIRTDIRTRNAVEGSEKRQALILQELVEIRKLLEDGITEKEFTMSKAQLKSSFILGLESAYNRMSALGHNQILLNRVIPPEETIAAIENVTIDDVITVARQMFTGPRAYAVVGRKAEKYG